MTVAEKRFTVVSPDPPEPPYPADTRAKGLMFDVDVERLYMSKTWQLAPAELRPWLLRLLIESWRSIPVGSYEDDDELIAARIQMPEALFQAHRKNLMRGWIRHRDGNLYHPQITRLVLKMTTWRDQERTRKRLWRDKMSHGTDAGRTRDSVGLTAVDDTSSSSSSPSSSSSSSPSRLVGVANAIVAFAGGEPDRTAANPDPPAAENGETTAIAPRIPAPVQEVFRHWQAVMDHPQARLDTKRRRAIAARLKEGYTVEQLKAAITGCKASAWHQGQNDRHQVFDDIELICRDAQRVEAFLSRMTAKTAQQRELEAWINEDEGVIEGECRHV